MTVSVTCRSCAAMISADDEDELVARVQTHAQDHGHRGTLSRKHILTRLHRQVSSPENGWSSPRH